MCTSMTYLIYTHRQSSYCLKVSSNTKVIFIKNAIYSAAFYFICCQIILIVVKLDI